MYVNQMTKLNLSEFLKHILESQQLYDPFVRNLKNCTVEPVDMTKKTFEEVVRLSITNCN